MHLTWKKILSVMMILALAMLTGACAVSGTNESQSTQTTETDTATNAEKNGEIYILCTSDVHCGIDQGFGFEGLKQVRDTLEKQGYETILVDDGDAVQGETIGTLTKGEAVVDLMNDMNYDVAIPGNHEFDYGMDQFFKNVKKAKYPYISSNFTHQDKLVLEPYKIIEKAGKKIAFVGVTTPESLVSSQPKYFQDENENYIYGFSQNETGEDLYQAVQNAVDQARKEGADYVYALCHLGNSAESEPWTYADVISHTNGIDVLFDGHSHDTDQVVMKNKDGKKVTRSAVGTKMGSIGYSHISAEGEIMETDIWTWSNNISAPELLSIQNDMTQKISAKQKELEKITQEVVAASAVELTIADPKETDSSGTPIRMVRRAETNLGDFCSDAYRDQSKADIALVNGGSFRDNIEKGDITYGDIINVMPFSNKVCVIEATGQQILDALEWGSSTVPEENGGFLHPSGLTYEIDTRIDSPCKKDEHSMFTGIEGDRRVKNVKVGDQPIDPKKTYTVAGVDYTLMEHGDGFTMFDGAKVVDEEVNTDNQVLIDYIKDTLNGQVGKEYTDLYGQGRIVITE